mgnify:CR=1 FL=1
MEKKQTVVASDALTKDQIRELAVKSLAGIKNSYAPYSHFHVSAVLLCGNGAVYTGNNIENAAYTPSVCAERCAFFKAVSEGERDFTAIALCGGLNGVVKDYCAPCGVCRQVMMEFCDPDRFRIVLGKKDLSFREYTLKELLPLGFAGSGVERKE